MVDKKKIEALTLRRFNEMYHNENVKFGGWNKYHIPGEKKYFLSLYCPFANFKDPFGVYWHLGKFHIPSYANLSARQQARLENICETLNSNQSLMRACREIDRLIDLKATRSFTGKYFNY